MPSDSQQKGSGQKGKYTPSKRSRQSFRLHDLVFEVDVEASLFEELQVHISSYEATQAKPDLLIRLDKSPRLTLRVGKQLFEKIPDSCTMMHLLEAAIYRLFLEQTQAHVVLHAASLARKNHALVIAGPSGQGKSTLALALLARGLKYMSEEWAVFDDQSLARGLTRPLHLDKVPSWEKRCKAVTSQTPPGAPRSCVLIPPLDQIEHRWLPCVAIVILQREVQSGDEPETTTLTRVSPLSEALGLLQGSLVNAGHDPLFSLTNLVERVPLYRLRFSEAHAAAHLLDTELLELD